MGTGGDVDIRSGKSTPKSSGAVSIRTQNAGKSGVSGALTFATGTTSNGDSGSITLSTGVANSGKAGGISLSIGSGNYQGGGNININGGQSNHATQSDSLSQTSGNILVVGGDSNSGTGGDLEITAGAGVNSGGNIYIKPGSGSYGTIQFKRSDSDVAFYDYGTRKWTSGEIVSTGDSSNDAACSAACELTPHCIGFTRYSGLCRLTYELKHTFDATGALGSGTTNAMSFTSPASGSSGAGEVVWSHSSGTTLSQVATFAGGLAFPTVLGQGARPITQIFRGTASSIDGNHRFTCSGTSWGDIILAMPQNQNDINNALGTDDSRRMVYNVVYRGSNTCEITFVNGGRVDGHMTVVGNSGSTSTQGSPVCKGDTETSRGSIGQSSYRDLSVQCCSNPTMSATGSRQPCVQGVNYEYAESTCAQRGLMLCSQAQVQANIGAGSGCSHDSRHVWTSTVCTLYAGPNGDGVSAASSELNSATLRSWNFNWMAIRITGTGN